MLQNLQKNFKMKEEESKAMLFISLRRWVGPPGGHFAPGKLELSHRYDSSSRLLTQAISWKGRVKQEEM